MRQARKEEKATREANKTLADIIKEALQKACELIREAVKKISGLIKKIMKKISHLNHSQSKRIAVIIPEPPQGKPRDPRSKMNRVPEWLHDI